MRLHPFSGTHCIYFVHSKITKHRYASSLDDLYCTIGTANFDNGSFRLNFEITMSFSDAEFAAQVRRMLEQDFADSTLLNAQELKARGFWFRFAVRCARLLAPVQ